MGIDKKIEIDMSDILGAREKRIQEALFALTEIVKILDNEQFRGDGQIKVVSEDPNYHSYHLEIPIRSRDIFIWEEVLHDPT